MSHYFTSLADAFFHWSLRYPTGGLLNVFFKPKEDEDIFILKSGKNIVESLLKLLSDVLFSYPKFEYHILKPSSNISDLGFPESTYLQNREGVILWLILCFTFFLLIMFIILGCRVRRKKVRNFIKFHVY